MEMSDFAWQQQLCSRPEINVVILVLLRLYRKEIMKSAILDMEEQKSTSTITLLQAI